MKRAYGFRVLIGICALIIALGNLFPARRGGDEGERGAPRASLPSEAEMLRAVERAAESSTLFQFLTAAFAGLVIVGAAWDVVLLRRMFMKRLAWPAVPPAADWGLGDVSLVVVVFIMVFFALDALCALADRLCAAASDISLGIAVQFISEIAAVACLFRCVSSGGGRLTEKLGISPRGAAGAVAKGFACYIGFLPVLLLLTWITELLARRAGIPLEPQEQIAFFFADLSRPALVFLVFFVAGAGPVCEEIFFRGFAYRALRRRWGRWPSILATAVLFSALHASFSAFLPIVGLGVLLAAAFEATGSLAVPITIHVCQNGLAVAAALIFRSLSAG